MLENISRHKAEVRQKRVVRLARLKRIVRSRPAWAAAAVLLAGCGSTTNPTPQTPPPFTGPFISASPCPVFTQRGVTSYCSPESAVSAWVHQALAGTCQFGVVPANDCAMVFPALAHHRYAGIQVEFVGSSLTSHPICVNCSHTPSTSPSGSPLPLLFRVNTYRAQATRNDGNPPDTYVVQVTQQGTAWIVTGVTLDYSHGVPPP